MMKLLLSERIHAAGASFTFPCAKSRYAMQKRKHILDANEVIYVVNGQYTACLHGA